jgi:hypothetical protein
MPHGQVCLELAEVMKGRLTRGHQEILVRWTGQEAADAS